MRSKWSLLLSLALVLCVQPDGIAKEVKSQKDKTPQDNTPKKWMAELDVEDDPLGMTEASTKKKKHKHRLIKGLGKELKKSGEYLAKDLALFLTVQDIDPYEKKSVPLNKKAVVLVMQFTDGQRCSLVRYPDRSFRAKGSIFEGTVLIPSGSNTFIVKYPNGVQGKLVRVNSSLIKSYRPDGTVTTLQKQMSGRFSIRNDKQGYLGMASTDRTGITYEQ